LRWRTRRSKARSTRAKGKARDTAGTVTGKPTTEVMGKAKQLRAAPKEKWGLRKAVKTEYQTAA